MPAVGLTMSAFDSVRCLPLRDVDSIARASSRSDLFNWPRVIRKEKHDNWRRRWKPERWFNSPDAL